MTAGIAIDRIKRHRQIAAADYMALTGVTRNTALRSVASLVAAGKIEHRGSNKTGGYYAL